MNKIPLEIKGLTYSDRQTGAYALLLQERGGARKIPIVIGGYEAQSIALALEGGMNPPRPLTHDLFKNAMVRMGASLREVIIHEIKDGVFYSSIYWDTPQGEEVLDARPSDAIALAIRFSAPIFATDEVVEATGLVFEDDKEESQEEEVKEEVIPVKDTKSTDLAKLSDNDLERLMQLAIEREDYELAARLRDEIEKRQ